jgi:hypothetical protein
LNNIKVAVALAERGQEAPLPTALVQPPPLPLELAPDFPHPAEVVLEAAASAVGLWLVLALGNLLQLLLLLVLANDESRQTRASWESPSAALVQPPPLPLELAPDFPHPAEVVLEAAASAVGLRLVLALGNLLWLVLVLLLLLLLLFAVQVLMPMLTPVLKPAPVNEKLEMKAAWESPSAALVQPPPLPLELAPDCPHLADVVVLEAAASAVGLRLALVLVLPRPLLLPPMRILTPQQARLQANCRICCSNTAPPRYQTTLFDRPNPRPHLEGAAKAPRGCRLQLRARRPQPRR